VTTLIGDDEGDVDGSVTKARFGCLEGLAYNEKDRCLYVADYGKIKKVTKTGYTTTFAGVGVRGWEDGAANVAKLSPGPISIGVDGCVYFTDGHSIRKITPEGTVTTLTGSPGKVGDVDGPISLALFCSPSDITVDKNDGSLYVADKGNHKIRKISAAGEVTTVAGTGEAGFLDGPAKFARFSSPQGIAFDERDGSLLVADSSNNKIRRISADGTVTTFAGKDTGNICRSEDGPSEAATFFQPSKIAINRSDGAVFVVDGAHCMIRKISHGQVTKIAGGWTRKFPPKDGNVHEAFFSYINSVAVLDNSLYIADLYRIRKLDLLD